ncbi:MAG: RimK-like ATP-grasp domain [Thermomicrobiales bacterium]|jgi:[lysine-biosynthesis-protein LysW]--L-2-aminoadipate ligase|nr:RimK-like ATP-grasp domain [Thermomicrobiales bacterium]
MATVGVLCARGRVEEKALMAALAEAGIVSALFPPADEPLPVGPLPVAPGGRPFPVPQIVVDRHTDRQVARAVLTTCRALAVPALSAGIAATGDRLDVASALAAQGLPRPVTALCTSEDAALMAVAALELPATLLPLDLKAQAIEMHDTDAAEAVLEHRAVLGGSVSSLGLIQAGAPAPHEVVSVIVVDGVATALGLAAGVSVPDGVLRLAEEAARVLRADVVAIDIAFVTTEPLVWDVRPVPEFRQALPIWDVTVAQAIALAIEQRLTTPAGHPGGQHPDWSTFVRQGTHRDLVISA